MIRENLPVPRPAHLDPDEIAPAFGSPASIPTVDDVLEVTARAWGAGSGLKLSTVLEGARFLGEYGAFTADAD